MLSLDCRRVPLLACLLLLLMAGCGRDEVQVILPKDVGGPVATDVIADGIVVGEVVAQASEDGRDVVTVELDEDLGDAFLRTGLRAWVETDEQGGERIELDRGGIDRDAGDLPSGVEIMAKRRTKIDRALDVTRRWAQGGTFMVLGIGAVVLLLIMFIVRMMLRSVGGLVLLLVSLGLSLGLAIFLNPMVSNLLLVWVYPLLEAQGGGAGSMSSGDEFVDTIIAGVADPRAVALFVVWIPAFVVLSSLFRKALAPVPRTKSN